MSRPEKTDKEFKIYLLTKITVTAEGCWVWIGQKDKKGYGRVWRRGKKRAAHRASYEAQYGLFQDDLHVCHKCDNPPCINPDHLFLGTRSDNMMDCTIKGRNRLINFPELLKRGDEHWTRQKTDKAKLELQKISERRKEEWATGKRVAIRDSKGRIMGTRISGKGDKSF